MIKPYPFQQKTADQAIKRLYNGKDSTDAVFIIDEVGLGKTMEALEILKQVREKVGATRFKAIVITPSKRLISQWRGDAKKFNSSDEEIFKLSPKDEDLWRLYISGKITLINAVFSYNKTINLAFASGNELKNFRSTNYLEREYILSFFNNKSEGNRFFRKLGIPRDRVPEDFITVKRRYGRISQKDSALKRAIRNTGEESSVSDFKKRWLLNIGNNNKFSAIIVDEFHNYVNLAAKKASLNNESDAYEPDYALNIWDEYFNLSAHASGSNIKKIYLSATPFKPIRLNILPENKNDPVSYVIDGLSNSFTHSHQKVLRRGIIKYNELVLEIRKRIATLLNSNKNKAKVFNDPELIKLKNEITRNKKNIESILNTFLLKNRRKQKKNVRKTIPCKINIAKDYDKYIYLFEAMHRCRISGYRGEGLQTYFTSGNFLSRSYKRENYKALQKNNKYLKKSEFRQYLKEHPKLKELKRIIKDKESLNWHKSRGNPPCWIDIHNDKRGYSKALIFCGYRGTANYLEEELKKEYEHLARKKYQPSNVLKDIIEKIFSDIVIDYGNVSDAQKKIVRNFYRYLPLYIKRWGLRKAKRVSGSTLKRYIIKNNLKKVLFDYYRNICRENRDEFFDNIKAITEWTFMQSRHGVVARYGEMSGGRGKRSGTERLEDLRTAFNSPFYPFVLISTNTGSEGINLHSYCRNVVHYEQDWMPATIEQRSGRVDRINSLAARLRKEQLTNPEKLLTDGHPDHILEPSVPEIEVCDCLICNKGEAKRIRIYRLVMEGTIDEYMYNREQERALWVDLFVGGEDVNKMLDSSVGLDNIDISDVKDELNKLIDKIKIDINYNNSN